MTNYSTPAANIQYQINWEKNYQRLLRKFLNKHKTFDGSEVSQWMRFQGLADPIHHNLWAVQLNYYAGLNWFHKIGTSNPKGRQAHIKEVALWARV